MTMVPSDDCTRARRAASLRLDRELSELGRARLAAHLRRCAACAAYARDLEEIAAGIRSTPLEQPLRAVSVPGWRSRTLLRPPAAAAALVAVAAASFVAVAGSLHLQAGGSPFASQRPAGSSEQHVMQERRLVALLSSLNVAPADAGRSIPV